MFFLVVMQGAPGSGKSTAAKILNKTFGATICSTDEYFCSDSGNYRFDGSKLSQAHEWNRRRVENLLAAGKSVIVDNTNIKQIHANPYFDLAKKYGASIHVCRCEGTWDNTHSVPQEVVDRMRREIEELRW